MDNENKEEKNNINKKIKILLIDDDEMMRIYFRDIFWIHGKNNKYEIIMASTLDEAEKIILNKETRPDSVFLDVLMSGEKNVSSAFQIARSLEFINKIKKDKELSNIKIVLYSGQKEPSIKDSCTQMGVDGCLTKGELMPKEIISFTDKLHGTNS